MCLSEIMAKHLLTAVAKLLIFCTCGPGIMSSNWYFSNWGGNPTFSSPPLQQNWLAETCQTIRKVCSEVSSYTCEKMSICSRNHFLTKLFLFEKNKFRFWDPLAGEPFEVRSHKGSMGTSQKQKKVTFFSDFPKIVLDVVKSCRNT